MVYMSKTEPRPFQREELKDFWGEQARAWWWEPGTGKSKEFIDNFGILFENHEVDAAFLLAPNLLHRNFIMKEVPKHSGDVTYAFHWRTDRQDTKLQAEQERIALASPLATIVAMSYDGLMTERGKGFAKALLQTKRCLYGADESQRIKEPSVARTKRVLASASYAPYRRIMTGTPVGNRPWDVWTQMKFLKDDFWAPHGLNSIEAMKAAFAEWEKKVVGKLPCKAAQGREKGLTHYYNENLVPVSQRTSFQHLKNGTSLMKVPTLMVGEDERPVYKNLAQLRSILEPWRSRILKKDVMPELPDQTYTPLYFDMAPMQKRCYDQLEKLGFTVLGEATCTAGLALTVMLRLQQIACGYLIGDDTAFHYAQVEPLVEEFTPNPKIELLKEVTQDLPHQALIWARFHADIDQITEALTAQDLTWGRYDGTVPDDACAETEDRFHRGDIQYLVLTHDKGGEGLTLTEAQTAIHYSSPFKLLSRLQAEGRPHRIGQKNAVNNIDLIAAGTIEEHIVSNLVGKFDMASIVQGDQARAWLSCR